MDDIKRFYERYWNKKHICVNPFDEAPTEWTQDNLMWHLDFFKDFVGSKVLDVGCGNGDVCNFISDYCDEIIGLDISQSSVKKAREKYSNIKFKVGSATDIPEKDNTFDTVLAVDIIEHILDTEQLFREFNRVLKKHGFLCITTNELTKLKSIIISVFFLDRYFFPTSPHIRYYTRKNIRKVFGLFGFKEVVYKKNRTYLSFIPQGMMIVAEKVRNLDE